MYPPPRPPQLPEECAHWGSQPRRCCGEGKSWPSVNQSTLSHTQELHSVNSLWLSTFYVPSARGHRSWGEPPATAGPWGPLPSRGALHPERDTACRACVPWGTASPLAGKGGHLAESPYRPGPPSPTQARLQGLGGAFPQEGPLGRGQGFSEESPHSQSWLGGVPTPHSGASPSSGCGVALDSFPG